MSTHSAQLLSPARPRESRLSLLSSTFSRNRLTYDPFSEARPSRLPAAPSLFDGAPDEGPSPSVVAQQAADAADPTDDTQQEAEFTAPEVSLHEPLAPVAPVVPVAPLAAVPLAEAEAHPEEDRFGEVLKRIQPVYAQSHDFVDLLSDYADVCRAREEALALEQARASQVGRPRDYVHIQHQRYLMKAEYETWTLARDLFLLETRDDDPADQMMLSSPDDDAPHHPLVPPSQNKAIDRLFRTAPDLQRMQVIVSWLESVAASPQPFDEKVAWQTSFSFLRNDNRSFLQQLHPDAVTAGFGKLHGDDQALENALFAHLWALFRSGRITEAQEVCQASGQAWRAASFLGGGPLHDPFSESDALDDGDAPPSVVGNPHRNLWKSMCHKLSQHDSLNEHERALYGSLAGNLDAVLPVCHDWADHLWAHLKAVIDSRVDQCLDHNRHRLSDDEPALSPLQLSIHDIVARLQNASQQAVRAEATQDPYRCIQAFLMVDDAKGLVAYLASIIKNGVAGPSGEAHPAPRELVRFAVHLALFLRDASRFSDDAVTNIVLSRFVDDLQASQFVKERLVAAYVAQMSRHEQVQKYVSFLVKIDDPAQRQYCLQCAHAEGLDVQAITKAVVEDIRSRSASGLPAASAAPQALPDPTATPAAAAAAAAPAPVPAALGDLSQQDGRLVESIDWLSYDARDHFQKVESLVQCNAIARQFLLSSKVEAAKKLLAKIPLDAVQIAYTLAKSPGDMISIKFPNLESTIREHDGIRMLVDALFQHSAWQNVLLRDRPPAAPERPDAHGGRESVAQALRFSQQVQDAEARREQWHTALGAALAAAEQALLSVCDPDWLCTDAELAPTEGADADMVDVSGSTAANRAWDHASPEQDRREEMAQLRQKYIPQAVGLLQAMYYDAAPELGPDLLRKSVELANLVASDETRLWVVFQQSPQSLQTFLKGVRRASVALLRAGCADPLGYPDGVQRTK